MGDATVDGGPATAALRPRGVHDLRRRGGRLEIRYPAGDLVVVSGLPGSGKSTLIGRAVAGGVHRVDSQDTRAGFARRLPPWLPYPFYRPLARAAHYWRLRRAVHGGGALVVHDCGAQRWVRGWLGRTARRQGRGMHLLLLDVEPEQAVGGQRKRGRTVSTRAFARHRAGWRRLLAEVERAGGAGGTGRSVGAVGELPGGAVSVVLLDRTGAGRALRVRFGQSAEPGGARLSVRSRPGG